MNLLNDVMEYLKNEGMQPRYDEDKDIVFKYEKLTFIFNNPEDDENYFRLMLPCVYDVTEDTREAVIEAANETNLKMKLSKTLVLESTVSLSAEIFVDRDPEIDDIMPRLLRVLRDTRQIFYEEIG